VQKVDTNFVGCLKNFRLKGRPLGKWSKNEGAVPCSDRVERGWFINGGSILAQRKFRRVEKSIRVARLVQRELMA